MFIMNPCRSLPKAFFNVVRLQCVCFRSASSDPTDRHPKIKNWEQQVSCSTAKDVEFCPNRAREVLQNYVVESSQHECNEDPFAEGRNFTPAVPMSERDHLEAYQSGNSVSLYSVMQSNVPEPFATRGKSPTHLNMPGGSSSQSYKYLSGKMQNTHQSKQ